MMIAIFIGNKQRKNVAERSGSLFLRLKKNARCDAFVLNNAKDFFKVLHMEKVIHPFVKIFTLKAVGHSIGRQAYIDIFGEKKAKENHYPTWWPTPLSYFVYILGKVGLIINILFSSCLILFLETFLRKAHPIFYLITLYFVFFLYNNSPVNWFFISGIIPVFFVMYFTNKYLCTERK